MYVVQVYLFLQDIAWGFTSSGPNFISINCLCGLYVSFRISLRDQLTVLWSPAPSLLFPAAQPSAQCSSPVPSVPAQCPVCCRPAPSPDCGPVQIVQSSPDAAQFVDIQYLFLILSLRFLMAVYLQSCATQLCYRVVLQSCAIVVLP